MMWVRFPNGQVVQYNDATYCTYRSDVFELCTRDPSKGGVWICSIPYASGGVLEVVKACSAHNPLSSFNPDSLLELQKEVKELKRSINRLTKTKKP